MCRRERRKYGGSHAISASPSLFSSTKIPMGRSRKGGLHTAEDHQLPPKKQDLIIQGRDARRCVVLLGGRSRGPKRVAW